ncbi:MAG: hypothetical protein N5P05_003119 [Chroococcopsis gigantea SAG 12.99]|nr:hypothetical protein [Chroococcopsis gigantea SAG 12.99]
MKNLQKSYPTKEKPVKARTDRYDRESVIASAENEQ